MWFFPNSYRMYFTAGSTSNGNASLERDGVVGNKWNDIKVEAIGDKITLFINNVNKGTLPNTNRPERELKLYVSDKHHKAANAKIADLSLTPVESPDRACLSKTEFDLYTSTCTYTKLVQSIQDKLHNSDPMTREVYPCYHTGRILFML